jgi:hypothetical protein
MALVGELLHAGTTDADGRKLGGHVNGVDKEERRDDQDGHEDHGPSE